MDLAKLDTIAAADAGAFLHLRHPVSGELLWTSDDEETREPVGLWVLGADSKRYQAAIHDVANQRLRTARPGKNAQAEETLEGARKVVAKTILSFRNITVNGETISYSYQRALDLVVDFPWIGEQIDIFQSARGNFLVGESSTS